MASTFWESHRGGLPLRPSLMAICLTFDSSDASGTSITTFIILQPASGLGRRLHSLSPRQRKNNDDRSMVYVPLYLAPFILPDNRVWSRLSHNWKFYIFRLLLSGAAR